LKIDFGKTYGKVRCDFLEEVMVSKKKLPAKWVEMVMNTVKDSKVVRSMPLPTTQHGRS
jgi:hypothetical protein